MSCEPPFFERTTRSVKVSDLNDDELDAALHLLDVPADQEPAKENKPTIKKLSAKKAKSRNQAGK